MCCRRVWRLDVLSSAVECGSMSLFLLLLLLLPAGMCCIAAGFDTYLSMHTGGTLYGRLWGGCGNVWTVIVQVLGVLQFAAGSLRCMVGPCGVPVLGMLAIHAWLFAPTLLL
jgi:hypothetical protein